MLATLALGLLVLVLAAWLTPVPVAVLGDRVAVHYHGTLDDGTIFDSSLERTPLEFVVGSGQVIAGFDDAVDGLAVDKSVTVRMLPADAYGALDAGEAVPVELSLLPEAIGVGDRIELGNGSTAFVASISGESAMVVINHALAGQALTFEITLVEIK